MFMDIIFKGKMWRTANLKMTVIVIKLFLLVYKLHKYNDTETITSDSYAAKQRNSSPKLLNREKDGGHLHFRDIDKLK